MTRSKRSSRAAWFAIASSIALVLIAVALHIRGKVIDGWRVENTGPFSMLLPTNMYAVPVQGIDSYVGEYHSPRIELSFDYGLWSNDLSDWPKSGVVRQSTLGGLPAKIGTCQAGALYGGKPGYAYVVACYIPSTSPTMSAGHLGMYAYCKSQQDAATAHRVFQSIRLHPQDWHELTQWQRFVRWLRL
jgi:hypothetical protein